MRRSTRRPLVVGILIIAAALGFLIYQGISNNVVYYLYPHELLAKGPAADGQSFRLGGQVRYGSKHWNPQTQTLRFVIQDPQASIPVISHGTPPQLFGEGIGVVVEGTYSGGVFHATNLMIKHSSSYRAPARGHVPKSDNYVHRST